ncbi:MAG: type II toxin-antitoxin system RelE/ParE family toxin [Alphaproteobacteria bacterium]
MPLSRPLGGGLNEVRSRLPSGRLPSGRLPSGRLPSGRIARVLFYVSSTERMILLQGFMKQTQRTPAADLDPSLDRMQRHKRRVSWPRSEIPTKARPSNRGYRKKASSRTPRRRPCAKSSSGS